MTFDLIISLYGASETLEKPPKSASHIRKKNPHYVFILDDIKVYTLTVSILFLPFGVSF